MGKTKITKAKIKNLSKDKFLWLRIVLSLLIITASILVYFFQTDINKSLSTSAEKSVASAPFKMIVIDVGQGDSIFLEFDNGENMLVDCGLDKEVSKVDDFLKSKNISTINYLVYTHADADHVGGGEFIFDNYQIEVLYRPTVNYEDEHLINGKSYDEKTTKTYENAIKSAYEEAGCEIRYSFHDEDFQIGDCYIDFLSPRVESGLSGNNYSAVMMLEFKGAKILLTGDIEKEIEDILVSTYGTSLDADVLKVGHHGSNSSSTMDFLNEVTPEIALISVGENNYGHPSSEVLNNLEKANTNQVLSTIKNGNLMIGVDEKGVVYSFSAKNIMKFDMPIFLCVMGVLLALIWGIRTFRRKKKA